MVVPNNGIRSMDSLAEFIKKERLKQGLTQEDVAGLSGTSRQFVSEVENGKKTAQVDKVIDVIRALGLSIYLGRRWM